MTVSSTTNRVSYTGNGSTTAFPFPYAFLSTADLTVIETTVATGVQRTLALTTDYTISGTADATGAYLSGGTVNAVTAPASTVIWTILRDPTITQLVDIVDGDALPASSIEGPLDRLTMIAQRLADRIGRTLRQPDGDAATIAAIPAKVSRASMFLGFDSNGDPIAAAGTSANLGPVSPFINTLLDDADAATARATLGVTLANLGAQRADAQGSDIASAGTLNLETATGDIVDVTGTTAITAITLSQGHRRLVRFTGVLTLTNGASLVLPGGANTTTAVGDYAEFVGYAAGVVRCARYLRVGIGPDAPLVHFREEQASGSSSADTTLVTGSWNKRTLNTTKTNTIPGVSIASSQITLPAGTYHAAGSTPAYVNTGGSSAVQCRLRNVTDAADLVAGTAELLPNSSVVTTQVRSLLNGRFTLTAQKTVELQTFVNNSTGAITGGFGQATGSAQVFSELLLLKVG